MKRVVVLTGVGLSLHSGLGSYRDKMGLWGQYLLDDVATPEGWQKNPQRVLEFYNHRREQMLAVPPTEVHIALAELQREYDVYIVTSNVDDLHERAGSKNVLHLSGELLKVRSTGPGSEVFKLSPDDLKVDFGHTCPGGYQLRPHVAWFGERALEYEQAAAIVRSADILLAIGTSLQKYPGNYLSKNVSPHTVVREIDLCQTVSWMESLKMLCDQAIEQINPRKRTPLSLFKIGSGK